MIPRYTRPQMARIFAPEEKLGIWLDVELAAAEAMAALGHAPADAVARLKARVEADRARLIDPSRVAEIEATTRHDVIAFLTHVEEVCGEDARFLHLGLTSSDLLDTTLAIQLQRAADLLLADLDRVLAALEARAFEHKLTPVIGRSHGIHAEPTTFGLKLAAFHAELRRDRERLERATRGDRPCAISGAVGTFATVAPQVEAAVAPRSAWPRAGLHPGRPARPPRRLRQPLALSRAASSGSPPRSATSSAARSARPRSLPRRAERQLGDAAQAQPGPHRANLTGLARVIRAAVDPCARGRGALARARHQPLVRSSA